jgi:hypothetical protein
LFDLTNQQSYKHPLPFFFILTSHHTFGTTTETLNGVFAEFKLAHLQMQIEIKNKLIILADKTDNYKNLRDGWKGEIVFNDKKYTLRDLAGAQFPDKSIGQKYTDLTTAAYDRFRKYIWNLMIATAGTMTYSYQWSYPAAPAPSYYIRRNICEKDEYKSVYVRDWYFGGRYYFRYWYFTFDGHELSSNAAKELFMDDYPTHIINPKGLFRRDYVFKQFHRDRPDFFGYFDLRPNEDYHPYSGDDFDTSDFVFTGGDFKVLTK